MNSNGLVVAVVMSLLANASIAAGASDGATPPLPACNPSTVWDLASDKATCQIKDSFQSKEACNGLAAYDKGFVWDASKKCTNANPPKPTCGSGYELKGTQCAAIATTPTSSNSNYVGDCFKIYIQPSTLRNADGSAGPKVSNLLVLAQDAKDPDLLVVAQTKAEAIKFWTCSPELGTEKMKVSASDLIESGAIRTGWVYGALALPYKYHFDDKSISSAVSIGPYVGRRSSVGPISISYAVTAALTPISVNSTDSSGKQQSTTLMAFTYGAGFIFEVSKSTTPLRAGLFVGRDIVSSNSSVTYVHNRKNWLAFQIGYDFTGN